jgi:hypothetical protein
MTVQLARSSSTAHADSVAVGTHGGSGTSDSPEKALTRSVTRLPRPTA